MAFIDTETRPAGEVQQKVGRIKLSEAIRIGLQSHKECNQWCGCAIGLAHRALHDGEDLNDRFKDYAWDKRGLAHRWALEHGFDPILTMQAESEHNLGVPASIIADWLAAQGL